MKETYYEIEVAMDEFGLKKLNQIMAATGSDASEAINIALHSYWAYLYREGLIISED